MSKTFYFYDLETSGLYPREARIMQFGGQRTDMNLKPIGEPHNVLIKMTNDQLPDPFSVLLTGITPQQTLENGITEVEFLKMFHDQIALPDTIFCGYNSVRFDDEFMRYLHYRNFYDPYEWHYKDGRSRWDLLDVVRMTRALRPKGFAWPKDKDGKATNTLELLTKLNNIKHNNAHDALGDTKAVIAFASKLKTAQPKLFDFLLVMRSKDKVAELVNRGEPFVYTSGKYQSEFEKTTIAVKIANHPNRAGALVYDLRYDPEPYMKMKPEKIAELWAWHPKPNEAEKTSEPVRFPVKTLLYNRCPAVAPLSVLDDDSQKRLHITVDQTEKNCEKLTGQKEFINNILKALNELDKNREAKQKPEEQSVDAKLYDGFFADQDRRLMKTVQNKTTDSITTIKSDMFKDKRLQALWPLYVARNFPSNLSSEQYEEWEKYRTKYLMEGKDGRRANYFNKIAELRTDPTIDKSKLSLLEDLQLYGESLL